MDVQRVVGSDKKPLFGQLIIREPAKGDGSEDDKSYQRIAVDTMSSVP